jgi:hypothetical protein
MMKRKRNLPSKRNFRRRGQALIGLLIFTVLLVFLYLQFLGPRTTPEGEHRKSVAADSMDQAKEVQLTSNLNQIRQGIGMYRNDNEGRVPASMADLRKYLKDYPAEMWVNPNDNSPLIYDPSTGAIYAQGQQAPGRRWQMNTRDNTVAGETPAPQLPAGQTQAPAAPAPAAPDNNPYGGVPGVPNPNDIVSKIPQPGAGAGSDGSGY